ncbi:UdgX family uracil-DNA binding protein [Phenylobacterium sp.]|uniref:UdgX family uracil-DNA binding protein n=1 Tax=Phenylobacterium sp. TaxID=1871053 RepID=UPI00391AC1F4
MKTVRLAAETDFEGWREAARRLRVQRVEPARVVWTVDKAADPPGGGHERPFTAPRAFLGLARDVVLHRSDERFAVLYRLLWRLEATPELLRYDADPDVARARTLAREVDRAAQRMKAFTRFLPVDAAGGPPTHVAWFEPAHRVTERVAPFFARRFAGARFALLTPDVCVFWTGERQVLRPGIDPADAPREDQLVDYWRNLTRARSIPPYGAATETNVESMAEHQTRSEPPRRVVRAVRTALRDGSFESHAPTNLEEVSAGVDACRRCDLWRGATQGVAGEGPGTAPLMLVGEQPGDHEDVEGRPFVGPAGRMLDKALEAAGITRAETYVTNAVKHFKNEPRGKRRLHKTPEAGEVRACRWWLDAERRIVRPRVILALGATAAVSVFGRPMPIARSRGRAFALPDGAQGVVTYHPSYLLRVPDAAAKDAAFDAFLEDLRFACRLARQGAAA